jgi:hypothetical protein
MKIGGVIRWSILAVCFGVSSWLVASRYYEENWGWPLAIVFGVVFTVVVDYFVRRAGSRHAPFQLVLRLAEDEEGKRQDDETFDILHVRFKEHFPGAGESEQVRFDGFEADGGFMWFYFFGPDEMTVRSAVLPQLEGCQIREGSYFLSNATKPFAGPNDGAAIILGDSRVNERQASVS